MDIDLEKLKQLAGVYDQQQSHAVTKDDINPRRWHALKENIKRSGYKQGLGVIESWLEVGTIDNQEREELLSVLEEAEMAAMLKESGDNRVYLRVRGGYGDKSIPGKYRVRSAKRTTGGKMTFEFIKNGESKHFKTDGSVPDTLTFITRSGMEIKPEAAFALLNS
jgi:hypothetical protein